MAHAIRPTNIEAFFDAGDIIVSKTDVKGRITYANDVFLKIAGYREREVLGQPHSIVRHPDMPRAVFKLLWDTVLAGDEIFAYVKNMAKNGDHYWVFAHVTPTYSPAGQIVGLHSNRRVPKRSAVDAIAPVYADLLRVESEFRNAKEGLAASVAHLNQFIKSQKTTYEQLVLSL